jgi:hypothetical protein
VKDEENLNLLRLWEKMGSFSLNPDDHLPEGCCTVCMCEFEGYQIVTVLPCSDKHIFHTECIKEWLLTKNACPLCMKEVDLSEVDKEETIHL